MCTNFKHPRAADGTVCVGRTMEFPDVLPWQVPGTVVEDTGGGRTMTLLTVWSTVCNLTGRSYCYNTIDDPTWYQVDVPTVDFSRSCVATLTTGGWLTKATV